MRETSQGAGRLPLRGKLRGVYPCGRGERWEGAPPEPTPPALGTHIRRCGECDVVDVGAHSRGLPGLPHSGADLPLGGHGGQDLAAGGGVEHGARGGQPSFQRNSGTASTSLSPPPAG